MEKAVDGDYSLMHLDYTACGMRCGFGKIRTFEKAGVLLRHIQATVVFVNNAV